MTLFMWHYYVIKYVFSRATKYAVIFLLQDDKIPSAVNARCITIICEIYEMEIHDLCMSIWVML